MMMMMMKMKMGMRIYTSMTQFREAEAKFMSSLLKLKPFSSSTTPPHDDDDDDDVHSSSPSIILHSPPLLSLDLPEVWPPSPPPASDNHHFHHPPQPSFYSSSQHHTAQVIDGKSMAEEIKVKIAAEVAQLKELTGEAPCLAVILVGQRRDSETYVHNKIIACQQVGIKSLVAQLPHNSTQDQVLSALSVYNDDPSIHGILVQLPLPHHLDEAKLLDVLSLEKDVDGLHPVNMGNLAMRGREPLFIPCTAKGCIELLIRSGIRIMGKKAVVIGKSNIVGLPTSLLLQRHHATISIVHALTEKPEQITREADIVVTAAGVPNLVQGRWLKPGAVVIDVGTCPVEDCTSEQGFHLVGDVCFEEAVKVVSAITPVPGGVGPMTIAMLLSNTLDAAKRAYDLR